MAIELLRYSVNITAKVGRLKSDVGGWRFDIKFKATDPEAREQERP